MAGVREKKGNIAEQAEALLTPIVEAKGIAVYDVEYVREAGQQILRAYIDRRPEGVTIDDCEAVSRAFSDALDEDDFIPGAYMLEVSSPGLGRQLKKDRHLQYSLGEEVEVKTFRDIDGKRIFVGDLEAFDKESVSIREKDSTEARSFSRKEIAVIRLTLDI